MALAVQNKNFLALLNKLDIDVKQFPDKTFDGLFENVPDDADYFFNWFIENITPDNVLTQSEQATYFQLESTQSLPLEDEMNYVLSSSKPDFNELMSLNVNYVNDFLPQELDDLSKNYNELQQVFTGLEKNLIEVRQKQNDLKEKLGVRKKKLESAKQESRKADVLFANKLDKVKMFLLKEPLFSIDLDLFNDLFERERNIFTKFKACKLLENELFNSSKLDLLPFLLESDVSRVNISAILCEGFLRGKKKKIEFLNELVQRKSLQKSFSGSNSLPSHLINNDDVDEKPSERVKILELEISEKVKILSNYEIKKISHQYLMEKSGLLKCCKEKVNICKGFFKSNREIDSWLAEILLNCLATIENTLASGKQLCSKLNEYERSFSNEITNLELRKQRFEEVLVQQSQHPLLHALKNASGIKENPENGQETFKSIYESMLHLTDDSNFITHKLRNDLQSSIKMLLNDTLCGPTSELLFVPAELMIKLQNCEQHESKLVQVVKRLASKYVDSKSLISRSERSKLLAWIDILTNSQTLPATHSLGS